MAVRKEYVGIQYPNTLKKPEDNNLGGLGKTKTNTPRQLDLLRIEKETEIDGIGMGVLSDGTPYLTGRGLARLCGINAGRISEMQRTWTSAGPESMTGRVQQLLEEKGIIFERPYIEVTGKGGTFYAYPDSLCLAVLEYYAFDANVPTNEARRNFRLLAGKALAEFIFTQVGYDPTSAVSDRWRQFHDRVALAYNAVPRGYFSIFKEIADMVVTLGQAGLHIDEKFVPDISVGTQWAKYWCENDLATKCGDRVKYDHNYPDYFPQSLSNPQEAWCYPEKALGEFRKWMREVYIDQGKFKNYIMEKVKKRQLPVSFAQLALSAYQSDENRIEP